MVFLLSSRLSQPDHLEYLRHISLYCSTALLHSHCHNQLHRVSLLEYPALYVFEYTISSNPIVVFSFGTLWFSSSSVSVLYTDEQSDLCSSRITPWETASYLHWLGHSCPGDEHGRPSFCRLCRSHPVHSHLLYQATRAHIMSCTNKY